MNYFYAIVHKDEDSAYGEAFPDLDGCFRRPIGLRTLSPTPATGALMVQEPG